MIVIAGNCILEDLKTSLKTSQFLLDMSYKYKFELIYKSSWCKDNRSSLQGYRGLSIDNSVDIFAHIKNMGLKVITDFHSREQLNLPIIDVVDWIQVPAYLCMQTDLLISMVGTGKPINIKKGQFLSPEDMSHVINKAKESGCNDLMITERGTCFGYRDLVVDPRSFYILNKLGYPVIFDAGHSVRKYGIPSQNKSGGNKDFISTLARAAIATGIQGIFVEVHPEPNEAKCDAATQLSFDEFETLIQEVMKVYEAVNDKT